MAKSLHSSIQRNPWTKARLKALPGFVWVEIEPSAVKADRRPEEFDVQEPPGGLLHTVDGGVGGLQAGIGEPVPEVGGAFGKWRWISLATA